MFIYRYIKDMLQRLFQKGGSSKIKRYIMRNHGGYRKITGQITVEMHNNKR